MQGRPARRWRSQRVCFLPGESPCRCRARWFWLLSLREHQSRLSAHAHRFLFRERSRPSRPPVFFLSGTCEEKTAGQRFSAPGWKRAHAGSDPACLVFTTQRAFSRPFYPTWPASLRKRERSGLVWGKWRWAGRWQHVTGSFRCWGAVGLSDWPRPLRFARAQRRQSRDGCRTFPCPLQSGWRAGFGVVSTRGALSQPSGWVVSAGVPSGPSTTTIAVLPWSTWRAHEILALSLLCPPPYFRFICPHYGWWRWRKGIWEDASTGWVSGCTSLPTHCHRLEGESQSPVQAMQDHFSARWTLLRFSWTGGFGAPLYGGFTGLSGQAPLCHRRVWAWSCDSQGAEKRNRPSFASHQDYRPSHRKVYGQPGSARAPPVAHADGDQGCGRVSFLDAPISPSGLFGPAVKGFAERFTEAQKASQAMRHFLPKRSSPAAAQSRPRTAPTQQSAKPAPAVYAPQPARTQQPRGRSRSARRHPPPTRQGPRLKIALDPVRPASSWSAGQEEERVESRHGRTAHQKASHGKPLGTPFFSGCRGNCVCCYRVRTSDHATVRCDSGKNKTQTFSKREQFSSSVPHECPASVQPATRVYPTPCHAGRGLASHPRSVRVGYGDNKTRLFTPIRSKTPALQRRGLHLGAGRERSRSALRGDDAAGKRSHRNGFSSFERVRLLQPLLPRPQKGWRPPAHPRSQTPESRPHETAVQDDHTEADPLADLHRGLVLFSGPERCILSHPDSPPSQTILEIRLRGSGLPVHGPTLWAVSFTSPYFYEVHGRGSFPSETDGNPHSQLPRRLAHSGPVRGGTTFTQNPHPQPLRAPGAQGQFRQKRTVSQPTNIVPGYSSGLSSHESGDSARTRSGHSETRGHLQERHRSPTQSVSENAGPYGRSIASVTAGPAPHAPPSTLVETTGSTQRLASRTLAYQGESGLCNSPDPLEEPTVDGEGRGHGVGPHQESCHDRRLQHRLGGAVRRQTDLRPLVEDGERLPHQLLGNASSLSSLPVFPAGPNRTPCADSLRQHVRGVLYKSPGRCLLEAPLYSGRAPSGMGSAQPALAEGSTPAGQTEPRSRYVISEQCPLRGVDAPSAGGSEDLEDLWQGRSRPFRLQRQLSLPNLLFEGQGCVGPRLAQPPPLCIPPDRPASTGRQAYQGTGSQGAIGGPLVEEPTLVVRADSATDSSPLARAPETGSPLSGERNNMAPSTRAVGSLHLAAQWEPTGFPERVLNTISEARAPSTRRLYALKWSVFSTWCLNRGENPSTSELAVVLSFLQELLDKGRSHSTLKVFVAAIAAFHAPIAGQSVGRDNSVVRFLKGARRLNPPRPLTVPTWDLPTVLRALKGPPFEPLQSTDLRSLSLKTALLLALASVKRVGDLQALSTSPACLEFGPNDSKVVLKPRHGYVPKVLSTPFRAQVITLSALPPSEEDRELSLLCPVRALRIYFERSAPFRHTEQLFVSFGNRTKGHPVTKQRLSKWIVDAVMLAYSSLGLQCPIGVRAHSTRGIASSWAWSSGVSITEICTAAGWATPSTFARFYNLDIPALQARVLSA